MVTLYLWMSLTVCWSCKAPEAEVSVGPLIWAEHSVYEERGRTTIEPLTLTVSKDDPLRLETRFDTYVR